MATRARSAAAHVAAATAVTSVGSLGVFLTAALAIQVGGDLGFHTAGLGVAVGAYFTAGALTSIVLGQATERLGPSRALRVGALVSASCLAALAAVQSFRQLIALLAAAGVGNALSQPAANLYLTRVVDRRRQGLAFALKQSAVPAATLLGGVAVPAVALTIGWRWAYAAAAAMALAAAVLVPGEPPAPMRSPPAAAGGRAGKGVMFLLAAGIGLGAAAAGSLSSFAVVGAVHAGVDAGSAGLLAAAGAAIAVAVRLLAGVLADRRPGDHLRVVGAMLLLGATGYVGLAMESRAAYLWSIPIAFGAGWGWPGLFNLAVVRHNAAAPGAATGITQTGTYAGAVLGPVIFGFATESLSWTAAWLAAGVWSILAGVTVLLARARLRKRGQI